MHLGIVLQNFGSVVRGVEAERVEENVTPSAAAKKLLDLDQVVGHERTNPVARGIHEVDQHDLVFDQVFIEAHFLIFLSGQDHVRKIALPDLVPRRNLLPVLLGGRRGWRQVVSSSPGGQTKPGQRISSCDFCHIEFLCFSKSLRTSTAGNNAGSRSSSYGLGVVSPVTAIDQNAIMAWSSWTTLWQCIGYRPRKSRQRKNICTLSS